MRRAIGMMQNAWRLDVSVRDALTRSDNLLWAAVALIVPFGWVFLLWRLQPVRARIRALRHS